MNKWLEILIGLLLVINALLVGFGLYPYTESWSEATWIVIKGGIVWGVFFIGLLFLMLGISDLKN
ncbi:MAG TPA: hypothetical protein P5277_04225 [Candidatus Paceibacterota bacterium]|nr:hypothetical protein [Candidatus Paceibacterota bacterium]